MEQPVTDLLGAATQRVVDTVDSLADERFAEPSLLPEWTIGHVVAHLALNAEGVVGAFRGIRGNEPQPMYASDETRNQDIDDLAAAGPEELRTRLSVSATFLAEEFAMLDPRDDEVDFERVPGQFRFKAGQMPLLRLREVEIHHADLGVGYTHADWPEETTIRFLDHAAATYAGSPFSARAIDLARTWDFGGGQEIKGSASALAWWTTGRSADALQADGELPEIEGR